MIGAVKAWLIGAEGYVGGSGASIGVFEANGVGNGDPLALPLVSSASSSTVSRSVVGKESGI